MADDDIGSLSLSFVGDYSGLDTAFARMEESARDTGQGITDSFTTAAAGTGAAIDTLEGRVQSFIDSGHTLAEALAEIAKQDVSPSLDKVGESAVQAAEQMNLFAATLEIPYAEASGQLNMFSDALAPIPGAAQSATDALHGLEQGQGTVGEASAQAREALAAMGIQIDDVAGKSPAAAGGLHDVGGAAGAAAGPVHESESAVGDLSEKLIALGEALAITEAIKEFATEALEAYSKVQEFTGSIQALTGSAETAKEILEEVEGVAQRQPFAFTEIAGATQKLIAFGVEADQVPGIMDAAGNAARATGNSFDAIVGALGRVELTGQVTGRQLVQLGISWKDIAQTMGVSVSEAQEKLKKGNQEAAEDLEVLVQTVKAKYGALAEIPLSVGQQYVLLQNQMHTAMAAVGESIAPVAAQITQFLMGAMGAVKEVIDGFNALPGPIKDTVVVIGLGAAAFTVATLAAGAFGLALLGVKAGGETLVEILTRLGITEGENAVSATADAAAHTALAEAEGAAGVAGSTAAGGLAQAGEAAVTAGTGIEGAATAGTALSGVLGELVIAAPAFATAIGATFYSLDQLHDKSLAAVEDMRNLAILDQIKTGASRSELVQLGFSLDQIKEATGRLSTQIEKTDEQFDDFGIKVTRAKGAADSSWESMLNLAKATEEVYGKTDKAKKAWEDAKLALDAIKAASDVDADAHDHLAAATANVESKFKAYQATLGETSQKHKDLAKDLKESYDQWAKALETSTANSTTNLLNWQGAVEGVGRTVIETAKQQGKAWEESFVQMANAAKETGTQIEMVKGHAITLSPVLSDVDEHTKTLAGTSDVLSKSMGGVSVAAGALSQSYIGVRISAGSTDEAFNGLSIQTAGVTRVMGDAADVAAHRTGPAFEIVSGGSGTLREKLDAVTQSFQNGTAMANGHVATLHDVKKAQDDLAAAVHGTKIAYDELGPAGSKALEALRQSTENTVQIVTSFHQIVSDSGTVLDYMADVGVNAMSRLSMAIAAANDQFKAFAQGVGSFHPDLGISGSTGGTSTGGTGGAGGGKSASGAGGTAIMSGSLSQQSYDQLWEDYTRNVGLSTTSPAAKVLAEMEYQELQKRWANGDFGSGAAGAAKTPASSTPTPPAAATGGAGAAPTPSGGMGGTAAPTGSTMGPATGAAGIALTESNPYAGTPSFGQGPMNEVSLPPITPISIGRVVTAAGPSGTVSASLPSIGLANLPTAGQGGTAAAGTAAATPSMGRVVPIPAVAVDTGVYAQPTYSTPSATPAAAAVQQKADTGQMQWFGGLSPTSTMASAAIPTAGGTGAMTLAEMQAALGIKPGPAAAAAEALTGEANKAAAVQAAQPGATLPEAATSSTQLPEIASVLTTFYMALEKAVSGLESFAHSTTTAAAGGKQIIVNINNPVVTNQSDLDKMVNQIQNAGMLVS